MLFVSPLPRRSPSARAAGSTTTSQSFRSLAQLILLACMAFQFLLPRHARASLLDYDAAIRSDSAAGIKPLALLTNAVTFFKTNRYTFSFGSAQGDASIEFIVEGDPIAGGVDGFLAVGSNTGSSLRFEQYNNTGQMGFTLNGVADYLFSPAVPSPNVPVHVTYVWTTNNHTMRLYLNGSIAGSQSDVNPAFQMPRGSGYLGNNGARTEGLLGTIHRATVYSGALSEDIIRTHSDAFNGIHRTPDILTFSANPSTLFTPDSTTLQWSVTNATQLLLNGQEVTAFAGITFTPTTNTDYQLIALNDFGSVTSRVSVTINPAPQILTFSADRSFVRAGTPVTLQWSTLYASHLAITPGTATTSLLPSGSQIVVPSQTTTYQLNASNLFGTSIATFQIAVGNPANHVVISEFMTDNSNSIQDEDGDYSDWIELLNPTAQSFNLQGFALTDDPKDLARWPLPPISLSPGQYLLVFASGKNRIDPAHTLHTNFRLSKQDGFLGLSNPQSVLIHQFGSSYPPQFQDVSYGILGGDPSLLRYFGTPTPNRENVDSPVPARPVHFSRPSGTFTAPFSLTLSSESTQAIIRYTLDGSIPDATNSRLYTSPLLITNTTRLRAIAITPSSGLKSDLSAATYLRLAPDLAAYSSTLPILVIDNFGAGTIPQKGWSGDGSGIQQRPRQPAVWATFDRQNGISTLTNSPQMLSRIGIRGRGAFSSTWRQPPYSVDTYDAADDSNDVSPLDMPSHSEWILYYPDPDPNKDPAMVFNTFAYDLSRDMGGRYSVRYRWVEAFVNEDGGDLRLADRRGVYAIVEKVARGKERLDFQPLSNDGSTGGWLLSLNRMDAIPETGWPAPNGARQPWFFHTAGPNRKLESKPNSSVVGDDIPQQSNGYLNFDTPNGYVINTNQRASIEGWFKQFEDVLYNNATWRHPTLGYRRYLDTQDFADYFILNVLTHNGDGLLISMFPWKGDDDKLRMGPAWDYNWSAYYVWGGPTGDLKHRAEQLWYPRLFSDVDFNQEYIDRWWQLRNGALSNTNMEALIDRQMADISPAKSVLNGMPSPQEWITRLTTLKTWLKSRANWIDSNYLRPPVFSAQGGLVANGFQLAIGTTNGTIYFTTDGSDPRAPGGSIASNSTSYISPILINGQTLVQARALKGTNWSGLAHAAYYTPEDLTSLAITEIHYNPQSHGAYTGDDLEFIELKNTGNSTLRLGSLTFASGISFTFPSESQLDSGAFLVLGRNAQALQSRYPGLKVDGVYTDKLSNNGEPLTLVTPLGGTIFSLIYNDRAPWPLLADGWGFSIVPRSSAPPNSNNGSHWRSSSNPAGSPGHDDPESQLPTLFINEVVTHSIQGSDQIEIFNPGNTTVDLGGWFLSDDASQPQKFRISPNTRIAAKGYLVFTEADFNPLPGSPTSFSLSSSGDSIYLSSGNDQSQLTGYSHGFSFDAADPGTSFGRYLNSIGQEQFPTQRTTTLGSTNTGPSIGPVVLQEIAYHPETAGDEFIELRNITDQTVPLFDIHQSSNTWRIQGIGFSFPLGASLPPQGVGLVTAIEPAAFRAKYQLPPTLAIWGPYPGGLQGNGETLKLQKPGIAESNTIPFITVDELAYEDHFPWPPAADGSGASLQRLRPTDYGNDPASWIAASPTPGQSFNPQASPVIITSPPSVTYQLPNAAELTITASGSPPLFYQWLFQTHPISGATNAVYRIEPLLASAAGEYSVVIYNASSSAVSAPVTLLPPETPNIFLQPQSRLVNVGATATFSVGALGVGQLSYQWLRNGSPISQATNSTLILTNIQPNNAGSYQVIVSGPTGGITSDTAFLNVIVKPSILSQLPNQTVVAGENVKFQLEVGGTPPFSARWRRGATPLATVTANSSPLSFVVTNIQVGQSGLYSVQVSNPAGANVPSNDALITVLADSDRDHIPDAYESITPGLNPSVATDAALDFDQDSFSNLQEYQAGTDPNDRQSFLKWSAIRLDPSGVFLSFQAVSNRIYAVQFKTDVVDSPWSNLWVIPSQPQSRTEEFLDRSGAASGRFYRLITPP